MSGTLIIPRPRTNAHKICEHIYEVGAMNKDDCFDWIVMYIGAHKRTAYSTIAELRENGLLVPTNNGFDLSDGMRKYFDAIAPQKVYKGEIVPSRTPPEKRPLSAKYFISAQARRNDADVRPEHNIFNGSVSTVEMIRGVRVL